MPNCKYLIKFPDEGNKVNIIIFLNISLSLFPTMFYSYDVKLEV